MSLFLKDRRIIHFIHIPKTGGRSIRNLLKVNDWIDITPNIPTKVRNEIINEDNKKSKHQHRNLWSNWDCYDIDFQFSIVRNPYHRSVSQLLYNLRNAEVNVNQFDNKSLTDFFYLLYRKDLNNIGNYDNHFRPQVDFLGENTKVYKFENDLKELLFDLRQMEIVSKNCIIPKIGTRITKKKFNLDFENCFDFKKQYLRLYKNDFALFDYEI